MAAELLCDDPTDVWWEMAHKAHGWGRIVTIERLADMVYDRPDIQTWLVRHGCRNNIGPEHLAWTCATAGALADVLNCSLVDRATLEGAALILETLATPHVCPGMVRYPHGPTATRLFLQHIEVRSDMAAFVPALQALVAWAHWPPSLDPDAEPWRSRLRAGWTDTLRSEIVSTATRLLSRAQGSRLRV